MGNRELVKVYLNERTKSQSLQTAELSRFFCVVLSLESRTQERKAAEAGVWVPLQGSPERPLCEAGKGKPGETLKCSRCPSCRLPEETAKERAMKGIGDLKSGLPAGGNAECGVCLAGLGLALVQYLRPVEWW